MAREIVSGVYLLRCDYDDRVYVGSSVDIHKRWRSHIGFLHRRTHVNAKLQELADQYGADCLRYEIIEKCSHDILRSLEQHHLNLRMNDPAGVFNISEFTDCSMRGRSGDLNPFFGKKHSDATRLQLSEKAVGRVVSEAVRQKMSESHKGLPRPWRAGKEYIPVRCVETGETYESVSEAARALGRTNASGLYSVIAGRQKKAYGLHWEAIAPHSTV